MSSHVKDIDERSLQNAMNNILVLLTNRLIDKRRHIKSECLVLSNFATRLVNNDVYYRPSSDMDIQRHTISYFVNKIDDVQRRCTTRRKLFLEVDYQYNQETVKTFKITYLYTALLGYIVDCLRYLPYNNNAIYKDEAPPYINARYVELMKDYHEQVMPPVLRNSYSIILQRLKLIKDDFDLLVNDTRDETKQFLSTVKNELMEITWSPSRYMRWCLSVQDQKDLASRWGLIGS